MTEKKQLNPFVKLALDIGPLVLFFFANSKPQVFTPFLSPFVPAEMISGERGGIFAATAVFMIAVLVTLVVSYILIRRWPVMAIVSAVIVTVFGGATLIFHDETFIKLKPTIIYLMFSGVLIGGLLMGKQLLAVVFDSVFHLTDEGWRKLTIRWSVFFFALAILNEIVWRTQTTDVWVNFKVFGVVPLTFVFAAFQYPLMQRYEAKETPPSS